MYNLKGLHIEQITEFQNYKQRDLLQDYLIVQKKDDRGLNASQKYKCLSIQAKCKRSFGGRAIGNRMNVGEGYEKRDKE